MRELITNDRVIGGMTPRCSEEAARLYQTFVTGECIFASGPRVAEMCKLTENSFRDVNIAFANELSLICDELGMDVWELIRLANRHPRVNILKPGPGVGGHCIAVDPWFIVSSAPETAQLIRTAREVNDLKPKWVLQKVRTAIGAYLIENPDKTAQDVTIVIYGLTFKPDIDDLRESPALEIAKEIARINPGKVMVVEPNVDSLEGIIEGAALVSLGDAQEAAIHVILVAHSSLKVLLQQKFDRMIDACGLLSALDRSV
jgi:UDP-N-acetyl-D-mannosaminuronic acid dehydrogenase